ncbi:MAG: response regulator [Chitinivibrionales bacterium]|nr:response regulator [Chitinivibrionales bacterium]
MEILVFDESRKTRDALTDSLGKKNTNVTCCSSSNDFMTTMQETSPDRILLDVTTWRKGTAIYNYFNFAPRLNKIPVVFFNAPENFSSIQGRESHEQDRILREPTDIQDLISVVE